MRVYLGCGIAGLSGLPAASVQLILCDLPSGETRAPFDSPIALSEFWPEALRALHPEGVVVLMASSIRYASTVIASNPASFRYDLVWKKSTSTGFLNARRRPLRSHEFVLVFAPSGSHTYHPQMEEVGRPVHAATPKAHGENYGRMTARVPSRAGATDRFPGSVLSFASVGTSSKDRVHPQQKPAALMRWLVRSFTKPGDLVVDPCAGSGSTGVAAEAEGRRFVGFDRDPRFGT